ncbi:MAG: 16S rRNA (adenine(1518)-N(6)/adenine(1519)-N(6))-dimethyltransferase RsmA [Alphaproteobacteria bacterium]|nr:16S rRNA (adenine(1518)-N(6)/adenine(1519)-N(6))-dimethyltransferase RsmA [Alphaproteobacteria bacterium]
MPKSSLGQHFLFDPNLMDRIVKSAGNLNNSTIIEIGPGPGGLTRALLESPAHSIIAIEQDLRFKPVLELLKQKYPNKFDFILDDALKINLQTLGQEPRLIIANLPYNIATILLINWLDYIRSFSQLILMFQKEVADRLVAKPGSKAYGRLSILVQWLADVDDIFDIAPGSFFPPPKVYSTVVRLTPLSEPRFKANPYTLQNLTKTVFGQRRKMIRHSLRGLTNDAQSILHQANIAETLRPEDLTLEQFCTLANLLDKEKN